MAQRKKQSSNNWPASAVEVWPLKNIKPYEKNARTHPDDQIKLLSDLMKKHGVDQPIVVDESGVILKGHGRRLAALLAGFDEFPVVQHKGLSAEDKIALRIADNQVALLSGWDANLIQLELGTLKLADYPLEMLGFSAPELAQWMNTTVGQSDPEETPDPPKQTNVLLGDLWTLGRHRLICGDSTDKKVVQRLLDGARKPHLMVTDPPYGVEYDPEWRNRVIRANGTRVAARAVGKVNNDDNADWRKAWTLFGGDVAYVWHAGLHTAVVHHSLVETGFEIRSQIIWAKQQIAIGRSDYHWKHEPCFYAVRKGKTGRWSGDRKQSTVWEIDKPHKSETGHSTQKPVECMQRPIENNSKPGETVYEPFSGSGTTIIACERTARNALAIELDPSYVQVAIERWQKFTGQEATLDGVPFEQMMKQRKGGKPSAQGGDRKSVRRTRKQPDQPVDRSGEERTVRARGGARQRAEGRGPDSQPSVADAAGDHLEGR